MYFIEKFQLQGTVDLTFKFKSVEKRSEMSPKVRNTLETVASHLISSCTNASAIERKQTKQQS